MLFVTPSFALIISSCLLKTHVYGRTAGCTLLWAEVVKRRVSIFHSSHSIPLPPSLPLSLTIHIPMLFVGNERSCLVANK